MKTLQTILATTLLLLSFSSVAEQSYGDVTVSRLTSVYDGDTFTVDIDELDPIVGKKIRIRVNGVDTPEIKGKCDSEKELAIEARDYVNALLNNADEILLVNIKRGSFFRIIADVMVDGVNLADLLIDNNLGRVYGGAKQSWCD